jgi:hypothetical protein
MSEKKKVELPSGGWATFKDASTLRVKDRKKVLRNANAEEGLMQALSIVDGLIAVLVEEWSFEMLIPALKMSNLEELTMADYDGLVAGSSEDQQMDEVKRMIELANIKSFFN